MFLCTYRGKFAKNAELSKKRIQDESKWCDFESDEDHDEPGLVDWVLEGQARVDLEKQIWNDDSLYHDFVRHDLLSVQPLVTEVARSVKWSGGQSTADARENHEAGLDDKNGILCTVSTFQSLQTAPDIQPENDSVAEREELSHPEACELVMAYVDQVDLHFVHKNHDQHHQNKSCFVVCDFTQRLPPILGRAS